MKKNLIILSTILIFLSVFILASNCPPGIPKTYSGEVYFEGNLLAGTYEIRASASGDTIGIGEVQNGEYEIDVSPCWGSSADISFYINGVGANEQGRYDGEEDWGKLENLDLTLNDEPQETSTCGNGLIDLGEECDDINLAGRTSCGEGFSGTISCSASCEIDYSNCTLGLYCGDGTCNNGETCSSCSTDCGSCSSGSSSSSSSGGGGGSSSYIITVPTNNTNSTSGTISLTSEEDSLNSEIDSNNKAGMTGAAIGLNKGTIGAGIVIILVILIIGFTISYKRYKTKK